MPFPTVEGQADGASSVIEHPGVTSSAYRNQAMTLIGICRFFSRFAAQGREQDTELKMILRTCDDVLRFATCLGQKVTYKTNKRFEHAIQALSKYASIFHPGIDLVRARMGVAKRKDAANGVLYQVLKLPDPMVVNFVLFKTLPDPEPVVVRRERQLGNPVITSGDLICIPVKLSPAAGIEEVLWNFAHFEDDRRIALQDNPHFYLDLPKSSDAYTSEFKARPLENLKLRPNSTVYVLVDQPRRVFLETRQESRIYGNIFMLKDVMIFKDVHGVLEGESVVGGTIRGIRNLWRCEKFFVIPDSSILAYDFSLSPIITANSTAKRTYRDRIDLVRGALGSGHDELHIYAGQLPQWWTIREQFLLPSVPTSERPGYGVLYTTANALNGDILRAMFDYCRLYDEESWNLQLRWCKLSQVSRMWRHVIHQPPLRSNIRIPFTNGTLPLDMPSHLPPMPIVIDFRTPDAAEIDAGVLHAILQQDRRRRIGHQALSVAPEELIVPMNEPFPTLGYLSLPSKTRSKEDTQLIIPGIFSALNLRRLTSHATFLSKRIPLLASSVLLVTLKLADVQTPGYFPLEGLVTQLGHVPQLEELSVEFSISLPRPHAEGELLLPPIPLSITLPALRRLEFRGVSACLESLLSRVSAPLLERLNIALFNEFPALPCLSRFTGTTQRLRHPVANIAFTRRAVSFVVGSRGQPCVSLHISCNHFDLPIHSAMQVFGTLVPVLSFAEELTLKSEDKILPPDWQDEVESMAWHELLGPFSNVKKLYIGHPFASGFSSAMQSDDAELLLGLLPELQELEAEVEITQVRTAFAGFVKARQLAGFPVRLSVIRVLPTLRTWGLWKRVWLAAPSAPTSERPEYDILYTTADTLNKSILLTIFDYCRLDDEESWNHQLRWCKLSHVCRKWRHVIHRSFFHLEMHVTLTNGILPLDMLSHLPPLPIVIDHRCGDVAETLDAIQQRDGIRRIVLQAPSPSSEKLIVPMDTPFPTLEHLSLSHTTRREEGTQLMIPGTFLTPNLRRLTSRGTCLPKGLPLLASSILLVSLELTDIQTSGYFTPEDLVTQLQHTPQLEELSIGFSIPMPRPNAEGELLQLPMPLTTLPSLKHLVFRGVGASLETLLAQISAPHLERFDVTLFNQLTFTLRHLSDFTRSTEALGHPVANVVFNQEGVSFIVGPRGQFGDGSFSLQVRCNQFDWQIIAATQIFAALEPVLSAAEEVTFELDALPPDWRNAVDGKTWRELLEPFNSTKQFRIVCPHTPEIFSVLESYRAGISPVQLRASQRLSAHVESGHENVSSTSIDVPPLSGRPVQPPLTQSQHSHSTESFVVIDAPSVLVADTRPVKSSWFRRTVVGRVLRRLGTHVCVHG